MGKRFISFWFRLFCGLSGFSLFVLACAAFPFIAWFNGFIVENYLTFIQGDNLQAMAKIMLVISEAFGVFCFAKAEDFKSEFDTYDKESCPVKKTRKKRRTKAEMNMTHEQIVESLGEENPPKYSEETRQTRDDMFTLPEEATMPTEEPQKRVDDGLTDAEREQQAEDDWYEKQYGHRANIAGPRGTYHLKEQDFSHLGEPGETVIFKKQPWNKPDTYTHKLREITLGMSIIINNDIDHVAPNVWVFKKRFPERDFKCTSMGYKLTKVKRIK